MSEGKLAFGDYLEFDPAADQVRCRRCGHLFGRVGEDYKEYAAVERAPLTKAGPHRGEEYDRGRFYLLLYYCPGCGAQLEVQVGLDGAPRPGFWLRR